jgi:uncharacterized phage protein (TIGR02218 family)
MPRSVSANLKTHLAGNVLTVNHLWEITRVDATVHRFTDCDVDISYGGNTYKTLNSGQLTAIDQKAQLNTDNTDLKLILDDNEISKSDVEAGKLDFAAVKIYLINRESTADGVVKLLAGRLGEANIRNDREATIEFRSLAQMLAQKIGRVYAHECDADLGDARCGVTLATYTVTGTLTGVTDNQEFADSSRSESDDHFNYGLLTWTSGNNNGLSMEVKDYVSSTKTFTLMSPMPFTVQVGDAYSVYQGCDKVKSTCINDFNNVVNFRGFAEIPGLDQVQKIPDINPDAGLHD